MALRSAPVAPRLTVLEGGRDWRADEAHVEVLTAFGEQLAGLATAFDLFTGIAFDYGANGPVDLRWLRLSDMFGRMSERLAKAQAEYLALVSGPEIA